MPDNLSWAIGLRVEYVAGRRDATRRDDAERDTHSGESGRRRRATHVNQIEPRRKHQHCNRYYYNIIITRWARASPQCGDLGLGVQLDLLLVILLVNMESHPIAA